MLLSLDDMGIDSDMNTAKNFDQFKGKQTSYKDELYTTKIDHTIISSN